MRYFRTQVCIAAVDSGVLVSSSLLSSLCFCHKRQTVHGVRLPLCSGCFWSISVQLNNIQSFLTLSVGHNYCVSHIDAGMNIKIFSSTIYLCLTRLKLIWAVMYYIYMWFDDRLWVTVYYVLSNPTKSLLEARQAVTKHLFTSSLFISCKNKTAAQWTTYMCHWWYQ